MRGLRLILRRATEASATIFPRRHYPHRVRRSAAPSRPLSPVSPELPWNRSLAGAPPRRLGPLAAPRGLVVVLALARDVGLAPAVGEDQRVGERDHEPQDSDDEQDRPNHLDPDPRDAELDGVLEDRSDG